MLKVERKAFEKVIVRIIESTDKRELIEEFSKDPVFFCSVLSDISRGKDSPNYHVLKKFTRNKEIIEQFIVEQAKSILSYFAPDEPKEDYYRTVNVSPTASAEEVRKNQLNLTGAYHPDNTKKLNEDHEVLRDPIKRSKYNAVRLSMLTGVVKEPGRGRVASNRFIYSVLLTVVVFTMVFYLTKSGSFFRSTEEKSGFAKKVGDNKEYKVEEKKLSIVRSFPELAMKNPFPSQFEREEKEIAPSLPKENERILSAQEKAAEGTEEIPEEKRSALQLDSTVRQAHGSPQAKEITKLVMKKTPTTKPEVKEKEATLSPPRESERVIIVQEEAKEIPKLKETPKEEIKWSKYIVKKGDNLWEIARRFNTSVKNLKGANKLRSNKLDIGDVLFIPEAKQKEEEPPQPEAKPETERKPSVRIEELLTSKNKWTLDFNISYSNIDSSTAERIELLPIDAGGQNILFPIVLDQKEIQKEEKVQPEDVERAEIKAIRLQLFNSNRGILGPED